jgi:[ribosomal protein S18]-alanine N-acetyltransferase
MDKTLTFRFMTVDDITQVLEVEKQSFTLPWSLEAFLNEMTFNKYAVYIVMEDNGKIVGYCGSWVVIDESHITNIAVLPEYRGRKIGEALLTKMMELSISKGAIRMTLEVRVSNVAAISLYEKLGFQKGGIRKNYYTDNHEDAYIMWVNFS